MTRCGRICFGRRKINISTVFGGQMVGIREVADQIWLVSFMHYDLGFFNKDEGRIEPALIRGEFTSRQTPKARQRSCRSTLSPQRQC